MKKILLLTFLIFASVYSYGQTPPCGSNIGTSPWLNAAIRSNMRITLWDVNQTCGTSGHTFQDSVGGVAAFIISHYNLGSGTVTSVGITPGNGISISGSPITTSGNITAKVDTSHSPFHPITQKYARSLADSVAALITGASLPLNQIGFGDGTHIVSSPSLTWDSSNHYLDIYSKTGGSRFIQYWSPFFATSDPNPTFALHPRGALTLTNYGTSQPTLTIDNPANIAHEGLIINGHAGGLNTGFGINQAGITGTASEVGMYFHNTGTGGRNYNIFSTNNSSGVGGGLFSINDETSGVSRLAIDANGNIGIGTVTPLSTLDVRNSDSTKDAVDIYVYGHQIGNFHGSPTQSQVIIGDVDAIRNGTVININDRDTSTSLTAKNIVFPMYPDSRIDAPSANYLGTDLSGNLLSHPISDLINNTWQLFGNGGTNSGTNWLGTQDLNGVSIRTNQIEAVHIDSMQNVSIPHLVILSNTYARWATLAANDSLPVGRWCFINDRGDKGIWVYATSTNAFGLSGNGGFLNLPFYDYGSITGNPNYSGTTIAANFNAGIWVGSNEAFYVDGVIVFWNGLIYQVTNSALFDGTDPATNTSAYTLQTKTTANVGYTECWNPIEFDFANDWVQYRSDTLGNRITYTKATDTIVASLGFTAIDLFQWGNPKWINNISNNGFIGQQNTDVRLMGNVLQEGSTIQGNIFLNSSLVFRNELSQGAGINFDTLDNSTIETNSLGSNSNISRNNLVGASIIDNVIGVKASIQNNTLALGSSITRNCINSGSFLNNNTLSESSFINSNLLTTNAALNELVLGEGASWALNTQLVNQDQTGHTLDDGVRVEENLFGVASSPVHYTSNMIGNSFFENDMQVNGDVYMPVIGTGIIMKSPDGTCWRVTPSNTTGILISTSITCP